MNAMLKQPQFVPDHKFEFNIQLYKGCYQKHKSGKLMLEHINYGSVPCFNTSTAHTRKANHTKCWDKSVLPSMTVSDTGQDREKGEEVE